MQPASITKIMTALLALEHGNLSDTNTMSYDAVHSLARGSSHIALVTDEILTLEQALYALALESANDAANGIAEHIGGSMENFAAMMTDRAKQAGALHTNFANAHGLNDANHYTTAYDMARITMAALEQPLFTEIFGASIYEMPPTNKQPEARTFHCTNAMMIGKYKYDGIVAAKTGYTNPSLYTLVTVAERDGRTLIAVVMKSPAKQDRWEDTTALLDYGFGLEAEAFTIPEEPQTEVLPVGADIAEQADVQTDGLSDKKSILPLIFVFFGVLLMCWLVVAIRRRIIAKRRSKRYAYTLKHNRNDRSS